MFPPFLSLNSTDIIFKKRLTKCVAISETSFCYNNVWDSSVLPRNSLIMLNLSLYKVPFFIATKDYTLH